MVITEEGCIVHISNNVQYDRQECGYQIFRCLKCGLDVAREAEDTGCGG